MSLGPLLKVMDERDRLRTENDNLRKAELSALRAPAQFRRITKRTKITVPCVMIRSRWGSWGPCVFESFPMANHARKNDGFTHWLPFQWPGGGK